MINLNRLQNVHIVSSNPQETAAFYEGILGLDRKFADGNRWIQMAAPGGNFAIACPEEGVMGQSGAVPVFEVEDLAGAEEIVAAHGGRWLGERDMGSHGRVATLQDNAGNPLQLFCRTRG